MYTRVLKNITCIIWHIINLYTSSYGYMKGLIRYLPNSEVAVADLTLYPFGRWKQVFTLSSVLYLLNLIHCVGSVMIEQE